MKTKITLLVLFIVAIHTLYSQDAGIANPVDNLIIHEDNRSSYFLTNDLDKMRIDGWSNAGSISSIQIFGMRGSSPNPSTDINYYYAENANTGSWYKDIDIDPGTHDIYINVICNYVGCLQNGTNSQPRHFTYVKPYEKGDFYLERTNDNKVRITLFADYGIGGLNTGFYYRVFRNTTPSFGGGTFIGNWSQQTEVIDTQVNDGETYYYWVDVAMNNSGSYNSGLILSENRDITTTLSVDDETLSKHLMITLNSELNTLSLVVNNSIQIQKVGIYDIQGRLIQEAKEEFESIILNQISNGVYIVNIQTDKGIISKKILKE